MGGLLAGSADRSDGFAPGHELGDLVAARDAHVHGDRMMRPATSAWRATWDGLFLTIRAPGLLLVDPAGDDDERDPVRLRH